MQRQPVQIASKNKSAKSDKAAVVISLFLRWYWDITLH